MQSYVPPVDETCFLLDHVLRIDVGSPPLAGEEFDPDLRRAILEEAAQLAERAFLPLNQHGDPEGCRLEADGRVHSPAGFVAGYGQFLQGGWMGLSFPETFGGQGLGWLMHVAVSEYFLARIDGAPEGTKGISLFVVPKFLPQDGSRNALRCISLEEKMGIHGNATCMMAFDGAVCELMGPAGKGIAAMFTMMNEARLEVDLQGVALAEIARRSACRYASERLQGRAVDGTAPASISQHPDIRRQLELMEVWTLGARALTLWVAQLSSEAHRGGACANVAASRVALLTPGVKGVITDRAFGICTMAQQVFGGDGYIEKSGMSQLLRDARITMIYEGTNGIQALDLLQRKVMGDKGAAIYSYVDEIEEKSLAATSTLAVEVARACRAVRADIRLTLEAQPQAENLLMAASDFLHALGLLSLGYMWLRIECSAEASAEKENSFYVRKNALAAFAADYVVPGIHWRLDRVSRLIS